MNAGAFSENTDDARRRDFVKIMISKPWGIFLTDPVASSQ